MSEATGGGRVASGALPPPGEGAWPAGLSRPVTAELLRGGWVGTTWRVRLADGGDVVVKRTPYPADAEADGLAALRAAGVPVPEVLGLAEGTLVLERVQGPADWAGLGVAVARMHEVTAPRFGWHRDNRAGRFVQPNGWLDSWPEFFVERRVRTHLADDAVPGELRLRLERACDGPVRTRLRPDPPASLTHGDLWPGNTVDGRWVIDPEVSHADRELDLAYMHMAGEPFPPAFWAAYEEVAPLPDGYDERRPALELHHRLLQVRHFGDSQLAALDACLRRLGC